MPSDSELRRAVELLKIIDAGNMSSVKPTSIENMARILLSLAEQYLASGGGVEKKSDIGVIPVQDKAKIEGWNACCDAHKLAGYRRVPSVEEIERTVILSLGNAKVEELNERVIATAIHDLMEGEA